jgi:molybdopterin converting factor small subunit
LPEKASFEIEVIAGSSFGFERSSKKGITIPSRLRFCIPDDSQVYTIRTLVSEISAVDKQLEQLILDRKTDRLKGNIVIILNGTLVDLLGGLDTPVKVGDRLVLVPFMNGG